MFQQARQESLNIAADASALVETEQPPAQSSTNVPEHLLCKNRLQEYAQRSGISLPVYQTINEGSQHAPRFRSTVFVDETYITSPNTFSHRKAAEQDVASVALASLTQKIKEEGYPIICEDTVFCKSNLNEYAMKMNLEKPTYTTIQPKGLRPYFVSSLVFDGVNYTGEAGRTKKEAEQLAARAVILSIFGNSESGTVVSEIIKSKFRLYAALNKVKESYNTQNHNGNTSTGTGFVFPFGNEKEVEVTGNGNTPLAVTTRIGFSSPFGNEKDVGIIGGASNVRNNTVSEASASQLSNVPAIQQPFHEVSKLKWEPSPVAFTPIKIVPPDMEQPLGVGPSSARKRNRAIKKKMKKMKKLDAQYQVALLT